MAFWKSVFPYGNSDFSSVHDLYRAKNGLPLEGESHSRFISTKSPMRKNKDYRARPRNYVVGYPVKFKILILDI